MSKSGLDIGCTESHAQQMISKSRSMHEVIRSQRNKNTDDASDGCILSTGAPTP